ncbi:MAG: hypothetical protein M1837_003179 [Sclerophora amabilis]|nr:MAG: hypothetical protein M1837_003179 [Sclerophora amabilis]
MAAPSRSTRSPSRSNNSRSKRTRARATARILDRAKDVAPPKPPVSSAGWQGPKSSPSDDDRKEDTKSVIDRVDTSTQPLAPTIPSIQEAPRNVGILRIRSTRVYDRRRRAPEPPSPSIQLRRENSSETERKRDLRDDVSDLPSEIEIEVGVDKVEEFGSHSSGSSYGLPRGPFRWPEAFTPDADAPAPEPFVHRPVTRSQTAGERGLPAHRPQYFPPPRPRRRPAQSPPIKRPVRRQTKKSSVKGERRSPAAVTKGRTQPASKRSKGPIKRRR